MKTIEIVGDKSISHRALILGALFQKTTRIYNILESDDVVTTMNALRTLGCNINMHKGYVEINGIDFDKLEGKYQIECNNSGTTARLLIGLLSSYNIEVTYSGDASLSKRPMKRVLEPLSLMGLNVDMKDTLPLTIRGTRLKGIKYNMQIDSAQVKSAILLASLNAEGITTVVEKNKSRNHTELMLKYYNSNIVVNDKEITLSKSNLISKDIYVPGDISSASFIIVAILISNNKEILIKNLSINETRTGILELLDIIGATYEIRNIKYYGYEKVGDLYLKSGFNKKGFTINEEVIPKLIDEIPIISVISLLITDKTAIKGVNELIKKESNRLQSVIDIINNCGGNALFEGNNLYIEGTDYIMDNKVITNDDHRISMMGSVLKLLNNNIEVDNIECQNISYPNFDQIINELI